MALSPIEANAGLFSRESFLCYLVKESRCVFSQTVALCLAFSMQVTCYVLADGFICSNTRSFVSAVKSRNDTVSRLGRCFVLLVMIAV